jgi:hypothetical protein
MYFFCFCFKISVNGDDDAHWVEEHSTAYWERLITTGFSLNPLDFNHLCPLRILYMLIYHLHLIYLIHLQPTHSGYVYQKVNAGTTARLFTN